MAILFDDAASERMTVASAPVTASPLTMACWFRTDVLTIAETMMSLDNSGNGSEQIELRVQGNVGGDPVRFISRSGSGNGIADSTATPSANTWAHACGVLTAANSRAAFLNGANKGTDSTSSVPSGLDSLTIGATDNGGSPTRFWSDRIAEAAIWNVGLSDGEVAVLAKGFSPLLIRPESLVFYLPMIRLGQSNVQYDHIGGLALTEVNTPAAAGHPPSIIYPAFIDG